MNGETLLSTENLSGNISAQQAAHDDIHNMRAWLLIQAQLQLDYGVTANAVTLLEVFEAVYGQTVRSGLMLCRAWLSLNQRENIENRAKAMLENLSLTQRQTAVLHLCMSHVRLHSGDYTRARYAYVDYQRLISPEV